MSESFNNAPPPKRPAAPPSARTPTPSKRPAAPPSSSTRTPTPPKSYHSHLLSKSFHALPNFANDTNRNPQRNAVHERDWTESEDALLIKHGFELTGQWETIALTLNRHSSDCRRRFNSIVGNINIDEKIFPFSSSSSSSSSDGDVYMPPRKKTKKN